MKTQQLGRCRPDGRNATESRSRTWLVALALALFGVLSMAPRPVNAAEKRIVDWHAERSDSAGEWNVNRFGAVRAARIQMERGEGRKAALLADLDSGDDKVPSAQLAHAVPFVQGHRYRVTFEASAQESTQAILMVRRREKPFEPMIQRSVTLGGDVQRVELDAVWPYTSGDGDVRLVVMQPRARLRLQSLQVDDLGPLPLGTPTAAVFTSALMGIHVNKLDEHRTWPALGTGLVRLWDTRTNWHHLGPTPEEFDEQSNEAWQRLDRYVAYVQENSREAIILMTLGQPPRWASASPDAKCAYGTGTCGAPASLDQWRHYVRTLAVRYKGKIRHWELWNEPNYSRFYVPTRSLVELARVAHEELKAVDPGNKLVSPGYTPWGMGWLERFFREGGSKYTDIVGFHWYYDGRPERLAPMIRNVRETMAQAGVGDKPLWVTEGAPHCESRKAGYCQIEDMTSEETDAVVERAILTMWLNNVQAYAYYTIEGMAGRSVALLDVKSRALTPSGKAFAQFGQWMRGAKASEVSQWGKDGHAVRSAGPAGPFVIVWSEGGTESLSVPAGWSVRRYTVLGKSSAPIPQDRVLSIGRTPVMLQPGE